MKKFLLFIIVVSFSYSVKSQTPIVMANQLNYTYSENFSDINNWTFSTTTPLNGTFTSGNGAAAWKGNDTVNVNIGTIPSASKITKPTNFFQTPTPNGNFFTYSSGVYKGNESMVLLSTGTTNNTTSVAMDFFIDFTGLNAGTLSFDWLSLNNLTGDRSSSLKVYASVDGATFTEITAAQVLNITNNITTGGSIVNVALPSIFNNAATARIRFYFYNGTGGTTGSRPKLNIDNVKITALPTAICVTPTSQPINFVANTVINNSATFSFTAPSSAPQNYLVVMSNNNLLSSQPINNTIYNIGDNLGDGNVVSIGNSTNVTVNGLNANTNYYFFIYSVNNVCTGGPLYLTTNPLTASITTLAGALPCVAPTTQPTTLVMNNVTTNSVSGSFTPAQNTDEYLVIQTTSATFTGNLLNGTNYSIGNSIGNGTVISKSAATNFTQNNLLSGTTYYYFVFGLNTYNCTGSPIYNTSSPLSNTVTTVALPVCAAPLQQPTNLLTNISNTFVNGLFAASTTADSYLILRSTASTLTNLPINGTTYTTGNTLGNATIVQQDAALSFIDIGLTPATTYYYFVFAKNSNCTGTLPMYLTSNPLTASVTTTAVANSNYYYGNIHAHSSYSDGNKDNLSLTPADDYNYAKNSLCMDFLGISDHNHATAGMSMSNWQPGLTQATNATTNNFLALYGMEWGVISNGGHVLIYGTNQLIGWETNNYNLFVAKSDYLGKAETSGINGLFRTLKNLGGNIFATYAHPSFSDYNNIANIPFNALADSIVVGSAVESGVAFSTNTTYNDAPTSYGYFDYYNRMLSKGYHIGPIIDHDTHYTNFGRSNNNRLVVLMPSLTINNFYTAMKARNFYATQDCDTKVSFTLNNQIMGSIVMGNSAPAISVYANDPTNPTFTPTIKIMYGIAGSNILPIQIASATANTLNFTDFALSTAQNAYYYADITIAGNRTITAPIWYTKNVVVPVNMVHFSGIIQSNKTILLRWNTTQEINCKFYELEFSTDGVLFTNIYRVNANNSNGFNAYSYLHFQPNNGLNYYRIKQVDANGLFTYSNIISINLNNSSTNYFQVKPNPFKNNLILDVYSNSTEQIKVVVTDMLGKIQLVDNINVTKGNQFININTNKLIVGKYILTLHWKQAPLSTQVVKF